MTDKSELLSWLTIFMLFLVSGASIVESCAEKRKRDKTASLAEIKPRNDGIAMPCKTIEEAKEYEWFNDLLAQIHIVDNASETRVYATNLKLDDEIKERALNYVDLNCKLFELEERVKAVDSLLQMYCDELNEHLNNHHEERNIESVSVEDGEPKT